MSGTIRVLGYLDVTFRVPHVVEVDLTDFEEWKGGSALVEADDVRAFILSDDSDEWVYGWPNVDPLAHEVADYELAEVEILEVRESHDSEKGS